MMQYITSSIIIGGIIYLIYYAVNNFKVIDKTDPKQTQLVCDIKQLQERLKR